MEPQEAPAGAVISQSAPQGHAIIPVAGADSRTSLRSGHSNVAEVLASEGRRSRGRRAWQLALAVVAVVLVAAGGAWGWRAWQSHASPSYLTDQAVRGDITVTLSATGELAPTQRVGVSSLVTGTIASVDVDYNQAVSKGQPLAHLDPRDFDAQRERAEAAVEAQAAARDAAATTVTDAEATLTRAKRLPAGEMISDKDVELATTAVARARANLALAEAQLKAAKADLASAESNYEKTVIRSPIDGVALDVNAEVGQTVTTATLVTSLFTLATDLKKLDLELDIDEADVPRVKVGDRANFTVESAPDQLLTGVIRQVRSAPTVVDGVTSYKAIVAVDNTTGALWPGMTATADIQTDRASDVLTVSNAALRFVPKGLPPRREGVAEIYVLHEGSLRPVTLSTGISDGQRTAVTSGGLTAGDLVVTGTKDR
jgi:HlyD family secretion protein